jgi:hypothetical protein
MTGCPHAEYDDPGRLSGAPIIPGFIPGIPGIPAASIPVPIISESEASALDGFAGRLAWLWKV